MQDHIAPSLTTCVLSQFSAIDTIFYLLSTESVHESFASFKEFLQLQIRTLVMCKAHRKGKPHCQPSRAVIHAGQGEDKQRTTKGQRTKREDKERSGRRDSMQTGR